MNIFKIVILVVLSWCYEVNAIQIIYVDSKPYVFKTSVNVAGIIPKAFELSKDHCNSQLKMDYKIELSNFHDFYQLFYSNATYGEGALKNITADEAIWMPFVQFVDQTALRRVRERNLTMYKFTELETLVVVMPLDNILLHNKIVVGISDCSTLFFLLILFSATFSILIWLIEMSFNPDFEKFFLSGVGTGCWLSLVTVTTVGYGDVTPKTIIGRILCVIWMIFGIIFASVLTASVTDTVSGTSSLDINKKTIAVLSNSPEVEIAIKDYHADVVYAKTVEELSNIVRSRKAFAGLLNADIASHNQEVIRNERPSSFHKDVLIFAYTIPIKVTVYALVPKNQRIHNHLECMAKHEEEVLDSTDNRFKRKIQTEILRSLSVYSMFKNHAVISYVTIAIGGVFALGCIYEVLYKIKNKKNFQS